MKKLKRVVKDKREQLPFVHLHSHCEHSIRDAVGTVEDYVNKAVANKNYAFCITNHGSVGQYIRQYLATKAAGMKNIFGIEAYVNDNVEELMDILKKIEALGKKKDTSPELVERRKAIAKPYHQTILVKNMAGYKNILKLSTSGWVDGFYSKPMISLSKLLDNLDGIILLSGCMASKFGKLFRDGDIKGMKKLASFWLEKLGEDFYIEIQLHDFREQEAYNKVMMKIAKDYGIKVVITNDTHYLECDDHVVHSTLILMQDNFSWGDLEKGTKGARSYETKQLYYSSEQELYERWKKEHSHYITEEEYIEFVLNTKEVADKVEHIDITAKNKIKSFVEPAEMGAQTLRDEIRKGWIKRGIKGKVYHDRIKNELEVVLKLGYEHYFLIVQDYVKWAKETYGEEYVGDARGSGGGSLINYLLGITNVEPIKYKLLFERFLNEARDDIPDIDVDFDPSIRDKVKEYIINKWGSDHVASIGTYGTYKTRAVVGEVSGAFDIPVGEFRRITKAFEDDVDTHAWEELKSLYPEFDKFCEKYPKAMKVAKKLRGQIRNISTTASGVVITRDIITDEIPLMRKEDRIITAWQEGMTRGEVSKTGNPKFDLLGLTTLKINREANDMLEKRTGKRIEWDKIDYDADPKAMKLARDGKVRGVFQFESDTMQRMLRDAEVKSLEDLSAISGLGRPGPLRAGVDRDYCARASGKKEFTIPELEVDVLKDTYGIMVYQENIMQISQIVGGFTLTEADRLRKLLVKAKVEQREAFKEELKTVHTQFVEGGLTKGYTKDELEDKWDKMIQFSGYGFNRAHSIGYAKISKRCLYQKAHSRIEFYTALLNNTPPNYDEDVEGKVQRHIREAKELKTNVLPASINNSKSHWEIEGNAIRFGFSWAKGVGEGAAEAIVKHQPFATLDEFFSSPIEWRKVNVRTIAALINMGAFDELIPNRKQLFSAFEAWKENKKKGKLVSYLDRFKNEPDYEFMEKLTLEKQYIGFYLSSHPLDGFKDVIDERGIFTISEALTAKRATVAAMVQNVRVINTRKGDDMAFVLLSDQDEMLDVTFWPNDWENYKDDVSVGKCLAFKLVKKKDKRDNSDRWYLDDKDDKRQLISLESLSVTKKKKKVIV